MNFVVDFYKSLDTLNLIIFWGIIIVVTLLLIFSIIIANKNKKLKMIISQKEKENNIAKEQSLYEEIPIINVETKKNDLEDLIINNIKEPEKNSSSETIEEEKSFVAEEHVAPYIQDNSNISKEELIEEYQAPIKPKEQEIKMPTGPYQRNVLREMSLSQTSPIGIVKPIKKDDIELNNAKELHENLNIENNNYHDEIIYREEKTNKEKYLEEVSRKLASSKQKDEIDRTEYEMQQEEDAIISYKELMEKKDTIKIIDEEEAVISIEELMRKKNQEEKLYNLTLDEENDKFINELKNFRNDL